MQANPTLMKTNSVLAVSALIKTSLCLALCTLVPLRAAPVEESNPLLAPRAAANNLQLVVAAPASLHLAGSERLSRAEIGRVVAARHPELEARIEDCSRRECSGPPRPADVSLNCGRVQALLSFPLPAFSAVAEL